MSKSFRGRQYEEDDMASEDAQEAIQAGAGAFHRHSGSDGAADADRRLERRQTRLAKGRFLARREENFSPNAHVILPNS